ncbi:MAG: hypothetical protein EP318_03905 [Rhodobacteraceae bacterium]|nr:MAG: hypothetical protein EP318_03905 [Paracoccaceae bacterium]
MGTQQYILFAVVGLGAILVGWLGYWLVRQGRAVMWWGLFAPTAVLAVVLGWQANQHTGWDALGYFLGLVVFVLPVLAGLLVGGGIGLIRRRRDA